MGFEKETIKIALPYLIEIIKKRSNISISLKSHLKEFEKFVKKLQNEDKNFKKKLEEIE